MSSSGVATWSKVAANNDMPVPNGWPEGQLPSSVNNCARQMMVSLRTWYEDPIWVDYGTAVSYASGTVFKVGGDLSSFYNVSRRVKLFGVADATYYGTVTDVTYITASAATSVTVDLDDSTSLNNSLVQAWYSAIDPLNIPFPEGSGRDDNILVAGDFTTAPWQQGTSFTGSVADATYFIDNWIMVCDGPDIVTLERHTDLSLKITVKTGNKKFGLIQWIQYAKTVPLVYFATCSLMIEARASATLNLKVGVISSTNTADSGVALEPISAWGIMGTNPTLVAGYSFLNTPANLSLVGAAGLKTFKIEGISVPSNANNIGLLFWIDGVLPAAADIIYVSRVKLQSAASATYFDYIDPVAALIDAQAYYETSYTRNVVPGASSIAGAVWSSNVTSIANQSTNTTIPGWMVRYSVNKIRVPVVTVYSTYGSASGNMRIDNTDGDLTGNLAVVSFSNGTAKTTGYPTVTMQERVDKQYTISGHYIADARLGQ